MSSASSFDLSGCWYHSRSLVLSMSHFSLYAFDRLLYSPKNRGERCRCNAACTVCRTTRSWASSVSGSACARAAVSAFSNVLYCFMRSAVRHLRYLVTTRVTDLLSIAPPLRAADRRSANRCCSCCQRRSCSRAASCPCRSLLEASAACRTACLRASCCSAACLRLRCSSSSAACLRPIIPRLNRCSSRAAAFQSKAPIVAGTSIMGLR